MEVATLLTCDDHFLGLISGGGAAEGAWVITQEASVQHETAKSWPAGASESDPVCDLALTFIGSVVLGKLLTWPRACLLICEVWVMLPHKPRRAVVRLSVRCPGRSAPRLITAR